MGDVWRSRRAAKPSRKSHTADAATKSSAALRSPHTSAATTANAPKKRLASVSRLGIVISLIFILEKLSSEPAAKLRIIFIFV